MTGDLKDTLRRLVLHERDGYSDTIQEVLAAFGYSEIAWVRVDGTDVTAYLYDRKAGERLVRDVGGDVGRASNARGERWCQWTWRAPIDL